MASMAVIKRTEFRILTSTERSSVASDLSLSSPIVVNRRRQDQDAGRENRESVSFAFIFIFILTGSREAFAF